MGFDDALREAGGSKAPGTATAHLRSLLLDSLRTGKAELGQARSGYASPVRVAFAPGAGGLLAALPVRAALRADPDAANAREWAIVAATVGAMVDAVETRAPASPQDLALRADDLDGFLVLHLPAPRADPETAELAVLSFDERVEAVDRLRARAVVLPPAAIGEPPDLRDPIGAGHPLRVAEAVARLGGDPVDPSGAESLEDALATVLGAGGAHARPHEDADPARRVARRILQRLNGMGKWGGYHTEFTHLPRGFAGNERALATEVGEALLAAGLLAEKPSVGQRHVFLNPRRAGDIHRLIETGELPPGLTLPK